VLAQWEDNALSVTLLRDMYSPEFRLDSDLDGVTHARPWRHPAGHPVGCERGATPRTRAAEQGRRRREHRSREDTGDEQSRVSAIATGAAPNPQSLNWRVRDGPQFPRVTGGTSTSGSRTGRSATGHVSAVPHDRTVPEQRRTGGRWQMAVQAVRPTMGCTSVVDRRSVRGLGARARHVHRDIGVTFGPAWLMHHSRPLSRRSMTDPYTRFRRSGVLLQ
jgi:hypothetical protein